MLRTFHVSVSKLDINIFDVANNFDIADVEFRCCKHVMFNVANIKF
jgi:hypothetical protein